MKRNVRLLAVSRMEGGFCIAGKDEESGKWVRPVRRSSHVAQADLFDPRGNPLAPLDLVTFDLLGRRAEPPHVEDFLTNFSSEPLIVERPSAEQHETILTGLVEESIDDVLRAKTRSLALIEPDELIQAIFDPASAGGGYKVRLSFRFAGELFTGESRTMPGYPCTDLRLRAWGRRFRTGRMLSGDLLQKGMGAERVFLVLGLTRPFNGNHWPMVVGFHTCPAFEADVDLSDP